MTIVFRRADPGSAADAAAWHALYRDSFGHAFPPAAWDWLYRRHPPIRGMEPCILFAEDGGRLIGAFSFRPDPLAAGRERRPLRAVHALHGMVDPGRQKTGIFGRLIAASADLPMVAEAEVVYSYALHPASRKALETAGYLDRGPLVRHARPLIPRPHLRASRADAPEVIRDPAAGADLLASLERDAPACEGIVRRPDPELIGWWFSHPGRRLEIRTTQERSMALILDRPSGGRSARVLGVWPPGPGRGAGALFAAIARDSAAEGRRLLDVEIPNAPLLRRLFSPANGFVCMPGRRSVRIMVRGADPAIGRPDGWLCIRGA